MTEPTPQTKTIRFDVRCENGENVEYTIPWCEWLQMTGSDMYNKYYDAIRVAHLLSGVHELALDISLICFGERVLTIPCACTPTSRQSIKHDSAMTEYVHVNSAHEERQVLFVKAVRACHTNDATHAYSRSHQCIAAEQRELIRSNPDDIPTDVWAIVTEYAGRPVRASYYDIFYQGAMKYTNTKKRKRVTTSIREPTLTTNNACCTCHDHGI
jgi:hypothetical protein